MGSSKLRLLERFKSVTEGSTGARFEDSITYDEWKAYGLKIANEAHSHQSEFDSCQWKIGDWLNFGEDRFGEQSIPEKNSLIPKTRYESAVDETGYVVETLRNIKSICRKVSFRNDALTFSHHVAVAALTPEKQRKYLMIAAKASPRMSVSELRQHILKHEQTADDSRERCKARKNTWLGELALIEIEAKQEDVASWSRARREEAKPDVKRAIDALTELYNRL